MCTPAPPPGVHASARTGAGARRVGAHQVCARWPAAAGPACARPLGHGETLPSSVPVEAAAGPARGRRRRGCSEQDRRLLQAVTRNVGSVEPAAGPGRSWAAGRAGCGGRPGGRRAGPEPHAEHRAHDPQPLPVQPVHRRVAQGGHVQQRQRALPHQVCGRRVRRHAHRHRPAVRGACPARACKLHVAVHAFLARRHNGKALPDVRRCKRGVCTMQLRSLRLMATCEPAIRSLLAPVLTC